MTSKEILDRAIEVFPGLAPNNFWEKPVNGDLVVDCLTEWLKYRNDPVEREK
jgi:hypothetical protein